MLWIIGFAAIVIAIVGPIVWNIFVHPIRSAVSIIKLVLGLAGILYLVAGIMLGNFGYGALGVLLLMAASAVSAFQSRRV